MHDFQIHFIHIQYLRHNNYNKTTVEIHITYFIDYSSFYQSIEEAICTLVEFIIYTYLLKQENTILSREKIFDIM